MTYRLAVAALAAPLLFAAPAADAAAVGYTLARGGNSLAIFDIGNPGAVTEVGLSGQLDDIDFRPANGQLYGYSSSADAYYTVDISTGALTLASTPPTATTNGRNVGIDWNPTIDRMRTVSDRDDNIVFNPNDGSTTVVTDLNYAVGDANEGANPAIAGNAYTNSFAGATSTQQYALDYDLNALTTLANNSGVLATVATVTLGGSEFDFNQNVGFDIFYDGGLNSAYAVLTDGGLTALFAVNLMTGALTEVGAFANNLGRTSGLAIAEVPLPAGFLLFLTGGAGMLFARRRKTAI